MRSLLVVGALLGGCASSELKPVSADRVPAQRPEGARPEVRLTVPQVKALGRILEDAQELLFPVEEGHIVCQFSPQAMGVSAYAADAEGMRYVTVFYNPDLCALLGYPPAGHPIMHRSLAYVLTRDGQLLGPRVLGR